MTYGRRKFWETLQIVLIVGLAVSPFWLMASDLSDGSEAVATAVGGAFVGVVTILMRHLVPIITRPDEPTPPVATPPAAPMPPEPTLDQRSG